MAYEALYRKIRPKTLAQLIGQEHITTALTRAISNDRISHAHLLVGTRGTGKTSTARLLAKAMNCEKVLEAQQSKLALSPKDIPCGKCHSCLSINSSPDNVEFDAASNRSVEDVTRLLSTAGMAPLQSRVKTFIIDEVHMLSFEAVNSILKLIEEPPPNVAFFLATTEFNKVPQTIRSRCQILNFHLIPREIIESYLLKLAERFLKVNLTQEAAQKIATLAAGSMRDAVTYIDQCYAMADGSITIDDVNKTLGLISDYDLDEIISAVKAQDRAALSTAINFAFRSGLSAVSIAESLITRARDIEFNMIKSRNYSELPRLENFVEQMRKAVTEMQFSGVPDVIFEMALMKIAAPDNKIQRQENFDSPVTSDSPTIDGIKKIIDDLKRTSKNTMMITALKNLTVTDFTDDKLTVTFTSQTMASTFNDERKSQLEIHLSKTFGRKIKIYRNINPDINNRAEENISDRDRKNLEHAQSVFE